MAFSVLTIAQEATMHMIYLTKLEIIRLGGAVVNEFVSLVVLSLTSPTFAPGTIAGLSLISNVDSVFASLTISSVVAVVSVPGSLDLLLIGLCFLIISSVLKKTVHLPVGLTHCSSKSKPV